MLILNASTHNINLADNAVRYYTSDATGAWTFNLRGDGSTALNSFMANNQYDM